MKYVRLAALILLVSGVSVALTLAGFRSRMKLVVSADKRVMGSQQEALVKLEAAQENLKATLTQNQKLQGALETELAAEKKRFADLQQKLWEVMSQNKELIKKVVLYKVAEEREIELQQKLQENIRRNQELGQQLLALKKKIEVDSVSPAAFDNTGRSDELEKKIAWFQTRDDLNQVELNRRQEKIQTLQGKIQKMEEKLSLALEQFKEMERESALLHERNIALQIERETLMADLNAARSELAQLQEKLSQIGGLLLAQRAVAEGVPGADRNGAGVASVGDPGSVESGRKIDVELLTGVKK